MIADKDRSGWFGASDTNMIVGNWETASFKKWWLVKLGLTESTLQTKAMKVGNAFEHKILDAVVPHAEKDKQILIPNLHLRVNLDGNTDSSIHEVKSFKKERFTVSAAYKRQAQVEMFAFLQKYKRVPDFEIIAYQLTDEDYANYFNPIDPERVFHYPLGYDEQFIITLYLPRLLYLGQCLTAGTMPKAQDIAVFIN